MKKFFLFLFIAGLLSSCFVFKKKEKYGCPVSAKNTGAENVDVNKKLKKKDRYKGGNKFGY